MDLATLLAQGATAEALVRTCAQIAEADWQEALTIYGDPATSDHDRAVAYGKCLAVAGYRALLGSAVEIWDRQAPTSTTVVPIGDRVRS